MQLPRRRWYGDTLSRLHEESLTPSLTMSFDWHTDHRPRPALQPAPGRKALYFTADAAKYARRGLRRYTAVSRDIAPAWTATTTG